MKALIPLIEWSALPEGRGRRVCKVGLDLALFRIGDEVYAIEDSCPHAGASLSNGKLEGRRVACPAHGLKFDLENNCQPGLSTLAAKKYAVHVTDGMVMLASDAHSPAPQPKPVEKEAS